MRYIITILFLLFLISLNIHSQDYYHQGYVISNGGGMITSGEYENFIITCEPIVSIEDILGNDYIGSIGFLTEPTGWDSVKTDDNEMELNKFVLRQNYPNPFNPETTIAFNLPQKSNVCLEIFNIKGQKVCTLINEEKNPGFHKVIWKGLDKYNKNVSSGIYFYRIIAGKNQAIKKMVILQ